MDIYTDLEIILENSSESNIPEMGLAQNPVSPVESHSPGIWLYITDEEKKRKKKSDTQSEEKEDSEEYIRCKHCEYPITLPEYKTEIGGSFEHTFMNPEGQLFNIGCFSAADGCVVHGEAKTEWTWFQGYFWRVAFCGQCVTHLGWSYESKTGDVFFGLILDALV